MMNDEAIIMTCMNDDAIIMISINELPGHQHKNATAETCFL